MTFTLHLSTANAAFEESRLESEIAEILGRLQERLYADELLPDVPVRLFDHNGNRVGYAVLTEEEA